jgi:hypothetical protein
MRACFAYFLWVQENFSAVQTAWRSQGDSNLRYRFGLLNPGVSVSYRWQKHGRESCGEKRRANFAFSPISIRYSIDSKGQIICDSVAESGHLGKSHKPE